jgi:hypothetical protein
MELQFATKEHKTFEITVVLRDIDGNPIGRRTYSSDNPYKIWEFYQRNRGKPKKKKRGGKVPTAKEADKILKEVAKYAEQKQQQERNV